MSINGSFHTSGASIARGRPPRKIEQKPEPTISRGASHIRLPPGGSWRRKATEGERVIMRSI